MGFTGDRRADDVADSEDRGAVGLGHFDCSEGVGGFAGLRYGDHHVVGANDGIAVAELASVLHLYRDSGKVLDEVLADEAGVPRGSAANNNNALGVQQFVANRVQASHLDLAGLEVEASAHRVQDRLGLLKDFFDHEVIKATLFDGRQIDLKLVDHIVHRHIVGNRTHDNPSALDDGHFAVFEVDHLFGGVNERGCVTSHKKLVVAKSKNERRAQATYHHLVGFFGAEYDNGVGSYDFVQREAHGLLKVNLLFVLNVLNEVDQDLGIGVARERITLRCKKLLELGVVLNDSVVHDDKSAGIGRVRMRIAVRRLTVGGPTGVADSEGRMRTL